MASPSKPTWDYTLDEVIERVEVDGLEYTVYDYIGRRLSVDDADLRTLWAQTFDALEALDRYLFPRKG